MIMCCKNYANLVVGCFKFNVLEKMEFVTSITVTQKKKKINKPADQAKL